MNSKRTFEGVFKMKTGTMTFLIGIVCLTINNYIFGESSVISSIWVGLSATYIVLGFSEYLTAKYWCMEE